MGLRRYLDDKAYELVLFLEKCLHLLGKYLYERGDLWILLMIFPLLLWYILNLGTLGFFGWMCNNIYVKYEVWFENKTCSKLKKEYENVELSDDELRIILKDYYGDDLASKSSKKDKEFGEWNVDGVLL